MVVGQVPLAGGEFEEFADVMAPLGEVGESFGEDGRVVVSPPDGLRNGPEPRRSLPVEVPADALVEPRLMVTCCEVGLLWTGRSTVAVGNAMGGAPHGNVAREIATPTRKASESWLSYTRYGWPNRSPVTGSSPLPNSSLICSALTTSPDPMLSRPTSPDPIQMPGDSPFAE